MAAPVIRMQGAGLRAPGGAEILRDVDWTVPPGEPALVVGASGAGKSRLLRLVNRLDEPTSGRVEVLGRELADWGPGELRRRVGWVPQRPVLGEGRAAEILAAPVRLGVLGEAEYEQRRAGALEVVGLGEHELGRAVAKLSGGERQRLTIARALVLEPEILLLDEPTSALDGARAARVLDGLLGWAGERGATLVVATHRIDDVRRLGGQMLVLEDGRVSRAGPSREIAEEAEVIELMTGRAEVA